MQCLIEVECEGERVTGASLKVGFNFRGIEWLAQRKNITKVIALVERVCGICSNVHSRTFCMALEKIGAIEVPERAKYIRTVIAELERLHSHLLWAGATGANQGLQEQPPRTASRSPCFLQHFVTLEEFAMVEEVDSLPQERVHLYS